MTSNLIRQDRNQAKKFAPINGPEPHRSGAPLTKPWSEYGPAFAGSAIKPRRARKP